MKALAHSARRGVPEQYYDDHICGVVTAGVRSAERIRPHSAKWGEVLCRSVRLATEFHDLGKLDPANQELLSKKNCLESLPVKHWDTGVARLMREGEQQDLAAAIAIYSHHTGLPSFTTESERGDQNAFRLADTRGSSGLSISSYNDKNLDKFIQRHRQETRGLSLPSLPELTIPSSNFSALFHRITLSCLVDADHGDTARHGNGEVIPDGLPLNAAQRLVALKQYVSRLPKRDDDRTRIRDLVFNEAVARPVDPEMLSCDSPLGTGKTTAILAHLLNAAAAKKLRRIFVVLPYTNIINQSVRTYRAALTLDGEGAEDVVAAHHHRVEFDALEARQYSCLWHAPIVVTTAVQFFETLAAASTKTLRKLHQLPGSAIFIDEAHASLPAKLWPLAWLWLKELTKEWGCHCVLASGSLYEFWGLPEFVSPPALLPRLLPDTCRSETNKAEAKRVTYDQIKEPLPLERIPEVLEGLPKPTLMIVNTVQSAAVIADHLANILGRPRCEHLSTALTPHDRDTTYRRIEMRLANPKDRDWVLVATSCVEAGVDFDFSSGMRERAGLVNLLQISGRVNRAGRPKSGSILDFQLAYDKKLMPHPGFRDAAAVLSELFESGQVSAEFCLKALVKEMQRANPADAIMQIKKHEAGLDFPKVQELFRVIEAGTITVVVDPTLRARIEAFDRISFHELQAGSVQIWHSKMLNLGVFEFTQIPGVFGWTLSYNTFLGYMAGVLPLFKGRQEGWNV